MTSTRPPAITKRIPIAVIPVAAPPARRSIRSLDRVLTGIAAILAAVGVFSPGLMWHTIQFALRALAEIAPWLAVSVLFAASAKATGADGLIARAFEGHQLRMVGAAALVGALSPFCSCGVIPLVAGLLRAGVPLPPVMAFWISSPLMDPNMFIITTAQLGLGFAVAKTAAAVGMGAVSGAAMMLVVRFGLAGDVLNMTSTACGCGARTPAARPVWRFWQEAPRAQTFVTEAAAVTWFLGRWLALAFVLESLMLTWLPGPVVAQWLGVGGPLAIPVAVAVGIPAYLNGFAAVPLVKGLIDLGMSPAAGMAFMLGGGVTSIPAMIAVYALVKPRVFAWYLGLAIATALAAGYAYAAVLAAG